MSIVERDYPETVFFTDLIESDPLLAQGVGQIRRKTDRFRAIRFVLHHIASDLTNK